MYEDELNRVKNLLDTLYENGCLNGQTIILFGVSENTRQIIRLINSYGDRVEWVVDNDDSRKGSNCYQVPVKPVSELTNAEIKNGLFFIYSYFWREMQSQLIEMGVEESRIYSFFLKDRTLNEQFDMAEKGARICEDYRNEIGDYPIFLCPYTGTGDIYLIGTFWNEYISRNNIFNYIFIVVSKACSRVTEMFDIRNVRQITQIESSYVVEFYKLCGEKTGIKILNDSWWELRANPLQRFRGYKGLYFSEIFKKFVFDFEDDIKPQHPILKNADDDLNPIFEKYCLSQRRTVVLSPYSNTLSDLAGVFWINLVNQLKTKGLCVCTNCGSDEKPIEGTDGIFVPLNIAPQFIEKSGCFIGVRSGFCDCISAANAQKIILYDRKNRFFNCSAFEYFNLKNMGLCDDAIEIEYDTANTDELTDRILSYIK